MRTVHNLKGEKFGKLQVIEKINTSKGKPTAWTCLCDCGEIREVHTMSLTKGRTKSCGFHRRQVFKNSVTTHGASFTKEYSSWCHMLQRTGNAKNLGYKNYGGRGISVCDRWSSSFENFLEDMGKMPSPQHTLERKNNEDNYNPSNCVWATRKEQGMNRRSNRLINYQGEIRPLTEWARIKGLVPMSLSYRLNHGWGVAEALNTPSGGKRK